MRNRVKELRMVKASELRQNPRNWRRHPKAQTDAMKAILEEVGWADALIAYETPDGLTLIDGHLRAGLNSKTEVPVLVLDVNDEEADKILLTLDPLASMARPDQDALLSLLEDTAFDSQAIKDMLEALANGETQPLDDFPEVPDGERSLFGQMTFTVSHAQKELIERALRDAKAKGDFNSMDNENSNGNALAFICGEYLSE